MKKIIMFLCLMILFTANSHAIPLPYNAESWNKLSELGPSEEKLAKKMLVRGVYEGAFATNPHKARKLLVTNVDFDDLVFKVNRFYIDKKNALIPLGLALRVISMEIRGARSRR
ncbi:MAG: hypothetical protein HQ549_06410 [Candidatus Omnitrophica bacterium]|nr:hypothetical protein [Candidatus Omnitrophota bacterium]